MRALRAVLRALFWTALSTIVLAASVVYHLRLPLARQIAKNLTNAFVTGEIRGELAIGRFDQLTLDHVTARHVALFDGEGRRIIVADRVELAPDFAMLRRGVLRFRVGKLYGAIVRLVDNGEGEPSLFTTFDARHPSHGGGGEPLHALVDRVELYDLTLYGQVVQLRNVRAQHLDAVGRLEIGRTVEIAIESARGEMTMPFDFVGQIEQLSGTVSTDKLRGVKLDARTRRDDEEALAHIEYRSDVPSQPQLLDLTVLTSNISTDTLRKMDFSFARPLAPNLRGRFHLAGPPSQLAIEAQVQSDAGNADVNGMIDASGVAVQVWSQSIAIDKLIDGGPTVTVRGSLQISLPDASAQPHVHVVLASVRYRGLVVPPFELDGELIDGGVRIDRARATQGGQIAVRGLVNFDGSSDLKVDAHFAAVQRDPNLSHLIENLEGTLTAAVRVRTPRTDQHALLDVGGKIELRDVHYGSITASRLELSGTVRGDPSLPTVDLQVRGENFAVLSYNFGDARFALRGGPHDYVAEGEFLAKGQKTFAFNASLAADLQGFVLQADPIEFTVGDESWRGLVRDLKVVNERSVELGLLRLASRAQRLEASGILRVKGEHALRADMQNFDLTAVRALLGAERFPVSHGYADASLELHGNVDRPTLTVQGAVREARVLDFDTVDAQYAIDYQRGRLELDSEVDLRGRGLLHLAGQGELDASTSDPRTALRSGLYSLALSANDVDLTELPALRSFLQAGRVDGSLELQGGLEAVTLTGNLKAKSVTPHGWLPVEISTGFQYDHNELTARVGAKDGGGDLAKADVNWHVDWHSLRDDTRDALRRLPGNDFSVQGETIDRPMSDLPVPVALADAWPVRFHSDFELDRNHGRLGGVLHGFFRPVEPISDDTCRLSMSSEVRSTFQLSGDRVDLSFEGRLDGKPVATGQGSLEWGFDSFLRGDAVSGGPRADFSGRADIAQIERAPGLCRHGRGQLHADWDLRSLFTDAPSGEIALQGAIVPEVRVVSGDIAQVVRACEKQALDLSFKASGDARQLAFDAKATGCSGGPTSLRAQVPVHWDASHRLPAIDDARQVNAVLDLQSAELQPLLDYLPGVRGFSAVASGQISARAQHGKVDYRGQLNMSEGKLYAIAMGQELRDVGVALTANGNWMKVESLQARTGRGSLDADGGIGFEEWWPRRVQMGVVLKDLPIEREGLELAWLTGSAAVIGEIKQARSQIALKLHAFSVRLPDASNRNPISLDPHPDVALVTDQPRLAAEQAYRFEIAIDGREPVQVHRNDFDVTLAAEVAVLYADPELHVGGYLEFERGTFDVFGKRFEVNRGSMRFDGSAELNPEVNLVATHQPDTLGSTPVYVNVSGSLAKPVVSFYSDQCPGEAAVVLLVSGRCPTESDASAADTRGTQDAFAAGIIGGILTLGARRQLGGLIPRLSVESAAAGTRTRLKAGFEAVPDFMRPLVQRVYVQGAVSTNDNTVGTASSQNTTTPDFLIELYFPNNIVGAGKVAPVTKSWGLDVTWEP